MEAALCNPASLTVPTEIATLAKTVYERIKQHVRECDAVAEDPTKSLSFGSMKEVQGLIEQAKNSEGLIKTLTKKMANMTTSA